MNNLEQKIKDFSEAIRETKEYQAYKKAAEIYNNDKHAQELLNEFNVARQNVAIFRQGNFPGLEEENKKLDDLFKKVKNNNAINDWTKTQAELQLLIGGMATELSNSIEFPFTLPQSGGGCCG